MTNEELLKEAKRRYPIGTIFNSTGGNTNCKILPNSTYEYDSLRDIAVKIKGDYIGSVYCSSLEKWAEIVESPKKEETSLVGRYVKCLKNNANGCKVCGEDVKKDKYYQIGSIKNQEYVLKDGNLCGYVDKPDSQFEEMGFKLMPIGWTPEQENYKYEVVHCKTQEEHQFFRSKNRNTCDWYASLYEKEGGHCFDINKNAHCDLNFYQSKNAKIYSFSEWCSKFNYIPDFMNKQETMFKKGDYIVLLIDYTNTAKKNLIFKQNKDLPYLSVEHDGLLGSSFWLSIEYTDKNVWRYATKEEIDEYNKLGKPYDVTTLQKKEIPQTNSIPEYVECIGTPSDIYWTNGKIYKVRKNGYIEDNNNDVCSIVAWQNRTNTSGYKFKPSTEEAYKNQFKQPIITKENTSNNDIEIGDEVELVADYPFMGYHKGDKCRVLELYCEGQHFKAYKKGTTTIREGFSTKPEYWKITKKACQTTTTYEKQVAGQPKNVLRTTDIKIPKSISVTLTNTEKEVRLIINKPKTIKI